MNVQIIFGSHLQIKQLSNTVWEKQINKELEECDFCELALSVEFVKILIFSIHQTFVEQPFFAFQFVCIFENY